MEGTDDTAVAGWVQNIVDGEMANEWTETWLEVCFIDLGPESEGGDSRMGRM